MELYAISRDWKQKCNEHIEYFNKCLQNNILKGTHVISIIIFCHSYLIMQKQTFIDVVPHSKTLYTQLPLIVLYNYA